MNNEEVRAANESVDQRIWFHTVGVTNAKRIKGTLPDGRPAEGETTGTGSLLCWHGHRFVLTAKHILDDAAPVDLRIFFPGSPLRKVTSVADLKWEPAYSGDPGAGFSIQRCPVEDIAVLRDERNFASFSSEFHDLSTFLDPDPGKYVTTIGFPLYGSFSIAIERLGNRENRTDGLCPVPWEAKVLSVPDAPLEGFKPENHYLVDHEPHDQDKTPHGYSGAAMWCLSQQPKIVWHPALVFCGICTHYYRRRNIERVVKASTVLRFIRDVFD